MNRSDVAVIGAGLCGLTSALFLAREGHEVTVYEQCGEPGGQLAVLQQNGVERFYHHLFRTDHRLLTLLDSFPTPVPVRWYRSNSACWSEGRSYPLNTPLELVLGNLLPPLAAVRASLATAALRITGNHPLFDQCSARALLTATMGPATTDRFWLPQLEAKFGTHWQDISAAWMVGRLLVRARSRGPLGWYEVLGYPVGGFGRLLEALLKELRRLGVRLRVRCPVLGLEPGGRGGTRLQLAQSSIDHQAVLSSVPSTTLASLCPRFPLLQQRLCATPHRSVVCACFFLDRQLSPHYWISVLAPGTLPNVVVEHTNLLPPEDYAGRHIVYAARYLDPNDPLASAPDERVLEVLSEGLATVLPHFRNCTVEQATLSRVREAHSVMKRGHYSRIPPLRPGWDSLFVACTAQVFPSDRSLDEAVRLAEGACRAIGQFLDRPENPGTSTPP
ncbi:MAG: hypothetical protein A2284_14000 [Deltaproteobacteria bacterium RIFOXYA12_FULL_61_11]|nr:MAG: hypothetical protein A2284_14000 [Deltaproteobacteria bacterium RIFOXYA12_FULL_61_11]